MIKNNSIKIGKKDIIWNYTATFFKLSTSFILLPFILKMLPSEKIGIWSIFMSIVSFSQLLDFGFNSSFTRNVTYVFSGVKELRVNGYEISNNVNSEIDYGLLKGLILSMKWFYSKIAIIFFSVLITFGTLYIYQLLADYRFDKDEVYISWLILCIVSSLNLYTLYYDSLLLGRGLIRISKQITIISNLVYLVIATLLILNGFGLIAIVSAQAIQVLIVRILSYRSFYNSNLKFNLNSAITKSRIEIIKVIYPNAIKIGLTILGGFLIQKSSIFIGSSYLSLSEIGSYGISMSLIGVIGGLSGIIINTYLPKITQLRVENNNEQIGKIYKRGLLILLLTYLILGSIIVIFGNFSLKILHSQTLLMSTIPLIIALFASLDQSNLTMTGNIITTKNEIPFYKASLISGVAIVICLYLSFEVFHLGLIAMVLIPLIVNLTYQSWKWPYELIKDIFYTK